MKQGRWVLRRVEDELFQLAGQYATAFVSRAWSVIVTRVACSH